MSTLLRVVVFVTLAAQAVWASAERDALRRELTSYLTAQYGSIEQSPVTGGILYDLVAPLSGIELYDGSASAKAGSFASWLQLTHELRRASLAPSVLPDQQVLRAARQAAQQANEHPLALALFEYARVANATEADALIAYQDGVVTGLRAQELTSGRVAALTALHDWTYHGSDVTFRFDTKLVYSNLPDAELVEFEFADGAGFRVADESGEFRVSYRKPGEQVITSRVTLANGDVLLASTRFDVRSLDAPPPSETWQLTASHSFSGTPAVGEAYILYAPGHTMVTRPVVLVEGLDLDNSLNWDELYDLMNQQNLLEDLRAIGFDAVVLNYGNSTVHVQDNAFLVQELIEELNSATGAVYPLVMVGTSLGGVTTRYALTYMEANALDHNVATFISVDSPQNGADIPVGIQHWADFFAGESAEAAAARDALLTPAPKQLLLYHFSSSSSGTANPDPMLAALQSDFASLGDYPALPRLVSVINGSGTQQNCGFLPGAQILRWVYDSFFVDIRGNVWAVSNTVNTRVLQGEINLIWPLPDEFRNVYIQPCASWDDAPGGLTATMAELDAVAAPYGDIQALYPSHCFIPSVSALDLNTSDPFFNIAGAANLYDLTPFDSVYFPVANQDHVAITPENAAWYLNEIVGPLAAPVVTANFENDSLRLSWTPVFGATAYDVYSSLETGVWPNPPLTVSGTSWTTVPGNELEFFQVVAKR